MKFLFQGDSVIKCFLNRWHRRSWLALMSLSVYTLKDISASQERLCHLLSKNYKVYTHLSVYTLTDISASQERLCHLLSKNYNSACAIC